MPDCPLCQPHAREVEFLLATEHWYAIHDADGRRNHMLLIPWRHLRELNDLDTQQRDDFWNSLSSLLSKQAVRSYRLQINGPGFQHIPHLHVHVWAK